MGLTVALRASRGSWRSQLQAAPATRNIAYFHSGVAPGCSDPPQDNPSQTGEDRFNFIEDRPRTATLPFGTLRQASAEHLQLWRQFQAEWCVNSVAAPEPPRNTTSMCSALQCLSSRQHFVETQPNERLASCRRKRSACSGQKAVPEDHSRVVATVDLAGEIGKYRSR